MPFGAIIAGGASLLGGLFGANSASSAAKAQAQSSQQAIQAQLAVEQEIQQQLSPWLQGGGQGLNALTQQLGLGLGGPGFGNTAMTRSPIPTGFQQSPGYQWQLGQGIDAIQNSNVGKTGALSGNMLKGIESYGSGLANQDFWNWFQNMYDANRNQQLDQFNMLNQLSGAGQNAAANLGGFQQQGASNVGNLMTGIGNARAAGTVGTSNALTGGLNNALQYALLYGGYGGGTAYGGGPSDWSSG
jgi:hypothetical protein